MNSQKARENDLQGNSNGGSESKTNKTLFNVLLLCTLFFFALVTFALYEMNYIMEQDTQNKTPWLHIVPWQSLAEATLAVVIIGFAYEWIVRKVTKKELVATLKEQMLSQQIEMRKQITKAIMIDQDGMRLFEDKVVEQFVRSGLLICLKDDQLAQEAYDSIIVPLLFYEDRRYDFSCKVSMSYIDDEDASEDQKLRYYQEIIYVEYKTYYFKKRQIRFTCVSSEEYNEFLNDPQWEVRCVHGTTVDYPTVNKSVFDVEYVKINGKPLETHVEPNNQRYVVTTKEIDLADYSSKSGRPITISYSYKVKVEKRGHYLTVDIPRPTRGAVVQFDFAGIDMLHVNVKDFFVSKSKPIVHWGPSPKSAHWVEVKLDDEWLWPKSGVLFSWVLLSEMTSDFVKLISEDLKRENQVMQIKKASMSNSADPT